MAWTLRYAVRSDRGLVRSNNEDSVYAGPRLLAVADGMGGHAAGEVASKLVIAALENLDDDRNISDLITTLRDAVSTANLSLAAAVQDDSELEGMGTTLTAIRFAGTRIALVHVGDSRAYLYRNGHLSQITHDDTYVQSLVDAGQLTSEEASHHPRKSVILRALNGSDVDPDISIREARLGDRYLICSDGLSDVVTAATLLDTLASGTPQGCVDRLIELALRGGGPDNITCVVADVVDESTAVDNVPLVGGAVVDALSAAEIRPADSPAARAARITREEPPAPVTAARNGRFARRRLLIAPIAAVIAIVAAVIGYEWTQGQYYVGRTGDVVAIYRGISGDYGPVSLSSVVTRTNVQFGDLNAAAKIAVSKGITAQSRADAEAIVLRLQNQLLPLCPTGTAAPTLTPTATPTHSATPSKSATATHSTTRSTTTKASATPSKSVTASPSVSPTASPTHSSTPTFTESPIPHVDCR